MGAIPRGDLTQSLEEEQVGSGISVVLGLKPLRALLGDPEGKQAEGP